MLTKKDLKKYGWNVIPKGIWFGGRSHSQLAEHLPDEALEDTEFEDLDFLVIGWKKPEVNNE